MKCRHGHVTNSSSSSFILGFVSEADFASVLEESYDKERLKVVYEDCLKATRLSKDDVMRQAYYYYDDHLRWCLNIDDFNKELNKVIDEIEEKMKENNIFVIVEYADEDGDGDLEHQIVPNLKSCMTTFNYH